MAENIDFRVKNGLAVSTTASIESTLTSVSTSSGALRVAGGVGIVKDVYVGGTVTANGAISGNSTLSVDGTVTLNSTLQSTASNNGALTVAGGVGVTKNLNVDGDVRVYSDTLALSTDTGALVVDGGIGVGGDLWVGGTLYGTILGSISTATNIAYGLAGQMLWQAGLGDTQFFGPGDAGDLIISGGTNTPLFVNTTTVFVGKSTTATNLNDGNIGSLPYQSGTGTTAFLNIGSRNQILTVNPGQTAPQWSNTSSVQVGSATYSTNADNAKLSNELVSTNNHFLTFVSTSSGYTDIKTAANGLYYIPASSSLGVGKRPNAKLDVNGGAFFSGATTVTNTTNAVSTLTGAFQVHGGASIRKDVWIAGTATITSTASSTSTLGGNALLVGGGVAIDGTLYVRGSALFENDATFIGTQTNVYSTNTVYTDNLIEIHYNAPDGEWTVDDGQTIGFIFNYYDDSIPKDQNGFFGLNNADKEFYLYNGSIPQPSTGDVDFSTATYGALNLGSLTVNNFITSDGTDTGALVVAGGVGIAENLWVGGVIRGVAEISGTISTATNILGGTVGQIPFQETTGTTAFFGPGSSGQLLISQGTTSTGPTFVNTQTFIVGRSVTATNLLAGAIGSVVYQQDVGLTAYLPLGNRGDIMVAATSNPEWQSTSTTLVGYSTRSDSSLVSTTASTNVHYIAFVTTAGNYSAITADNTGLVFIPSSNSVGISTSTPSSTLDVFGTTKISGITRITDTTFSLNTTTGALVVDGGVSIGRNLNVGSYATIYGDLAVNGGDLTTDQNAFNLLNSVVSTINMGGNADLINIGSTEGNTNIHNLTTITTSTDTTSTSSGALLVEGGAAIKRDLRVGGTIYGLFAGKVTGTATTATNIEGGTAGQIPYQLTTGTTVFHGPGTVGQLLVSNGVLGPQYTNTTSIHVGTANTSSHLSGGGIGSVVYQQDVNRTTFLPLGDRNSILVAGTNAPEWGSTDGIVVGQADRVSINNNSTGTTTFYVTFVSTSSEYAPLQVSADDGLTYIPNQRVVGINTPTPAYTLDVNSTTNAVIRSYGQLSGQISVENVDKHYSFRTYNGDLLITDETESGTRVTIDAIGNFGINIDPAFRFDVDGEARISGVTTITNVTTSSNTITGALIVNGGVGIGDSVYIKNRVGFVNNTNVSRVYQVYNEAEDSLDTVFE